MSYPRYTHEWTENGCLVLRYEVGTPVTLTPAMLAEINRAQAENIDLTKTLYPMDFLSDEHGYKRPWNTE
jgi:hypothetical protein